MPRRAGRREPRRAPRPVGAHVGPGSGLARVPWAGARSASLEVEGSDASSSPDSNRSTQQGPGHECDRARAFLQAQRRTTPPAGPWKDRCPRMARPIAHPRRRACETTAGAVSLQRDMALSCARSRLHRCGASGQCTAGPPRPRQRAPASSRTAIHPGDPATGSGLATAAASGPRAHRRKRCPQGTSRSRNSRKGPDDAHEPTSSTRRAASGS